MEISVNMDKPHKKRTSANFSYTTDLFPDLIEAYDKTLEMRNNIITIPMVSSMIVSYATLESLMNVSITKHNPNKFEDVGKI